MRHPDQRPVGGALLRDRRARRATRARDERPRAARGHVAVRGRAGALDLGDRRAVGHRAGARAARVVAPADRALPGAAHPRRPHHGRRQQRAPVDAPVHGARARGPARGRALRGQRRADEQPARARGRARGRAGGARHRRLGRDPAGGRRAVRADPRLCGGGRGSPHARARDGGRARAPRRGHGARARHAAQALRHAGRDPARRRRCWASTPRRCCARRASRRRRSRRSHDRAARRAPGSRAVDHVQPARRPATR